MAAEAPPDRPSKSQRKRDAEAVQRLGERLIGLRPDQLASLPLSDELREAVRMAQRITARGGRRRQLQLIGKLMRAADAEAITHALEVLTAVRRADTRRLHRLEHWRERLLREGPAAIEALLARYPSVERARVEALVADALQGTPGSRALFRYLRETLPGADDRDEGGGTPGGAEPWAADALPRVRTDAR